jgi:DNA-binding transcriptional LysR family regulator
MIRNLDISLLRAFVTVAGTGNMTMAADRLALTQGAVSQQIKRLEDMLQTALFDRAQRKLRLTRQGERLLGLSYRFLQLNDEIIAEMVGPAVGSRVRLGIPYDLVGPWLPMLLPGFSEANPHIEIDLVCAASTVLAAQIDRGELDVAIVEEPADTATGECLCVERLLWLGGPNGKAHGKRPLPLSIVSQACVFRPAAHAALKHAGIDWRVVFENGNMEATMTTVRADLAVTPSLASVVPPDLEVLPADAGLPDLPNFAISLFMRENHGDRAVDELAGHIRRVFVDRSRYRAVAAE